MAATVAAVLIFVSAAAVLLAFRLVCDVLIASMALRKAPEPHWSRIRKALIEGRIVRKPGLWIAERLHRPVAE